MCAHILPTRLLLSILIHGKPREKIETYMVEPCNTSIFSHSYYAPVHSFIICANILVDSWTKSLTEFAGCLVTQ